MGGGGGGSTSAARPWGVRSGQCARSNTAAPTAIGAGEREGVVRSKARTLTTGGGAVTGVTGLAGARLVGSSCSSGGVPRKGIAPRAARVALWAADPAGRGGPLTPPPPRTVARRRAQFRPPLWYQNKPPGRAGPALPRWGPPRAAAAAKPPRVRPQLQHPGGRIRARGSRISWLPDSGAA